MTWWQSSLSRLGERWRRARIALALAMVATLVRTIGVRRATALLGRAAGAHPPRHEADAQVLDACALGREIAEVAETMPGAPRCLVRSLLLWFLLRRRGAPSELHVGVRMAPAFMAHAWVELYRVPVNDSIASVRAHRRLWTTRSVSH